MTRMAPAVGVAAVIGEAAIVSLLATTACRPSDVLSVPPPAGVTPSSVYQNRTGAEALFADGKVQLFQALAGFNGLFEWSGDLADEFKWTFFLYASSFANIDARVTTGGSGFQESGDGAIQQLLRARLTLVTAVAALQQYEPSSGRQATGEAFALIGYAELLAAEDYCAGVPLDALAPSNGIRYGQQLTTDSLLRIAITDFDSAAANAAGDATVGALAAIGQGRALLDLGQFAAAAVAVRAVPTNFVYQTDLEPSASGLGQPNTYNLYDYQLQNYGCGWLNVADRKGANGLGFVSAADPRLVLNAMITETCDGLYAGSADSVWYYPMKFGNPSTYVPLARGVEARLIEAEAALQATQASVWAGDLNALRSDSADTKVMFQNLLPPDSTTTASQAAQVDVMFRERAFWLYGTGTRLGDMRRLVRQYGRAQSTVFPTGAYPNGGAPQLPAPLPNYGSDVNLTLPTAAGGLSTSNPGYKGCLTSTKVA